MWIKLWVIYGCVMLIQVITEEQNLAIQAITPHMKSPQTKGKVSGKSKKNTNNNNNKKDLTDAVIAVVIPG